MKVATTEEMRTMDRHAIETLGIPDEIAVEAIITAKEIRPERFTILDMGISRESAEHLVHMLYAE